MCVYILESQPAGKTRRNVCYEGRQLYLNSKTVLHQDRDRILTVGTHVYEFQCQLPEELPASFSTKEGSIHYYIEAVLDKPWRLNERIRKPFLVMRNESVNDYPEFFTPTKLEKSTQFGFLFWKSKPFMMTITLPRTVFEPEQDVSFKVFCNNHSNVDVTHIKVELRRVLKLTRLSLEYFLLDS